jgi:hypothetical protein
MSPIAERVRLPCLIVFSAILLGGCASVGGPGEGETAAQGAEVVDKTRDMMTPEGQILAALQNTAPGESISTTSGVYATAGETYAAASGRACRWVSVSHPERDLNRQLACLYGDGWRWAPTVLAPSVK